MNYYNKYGEILDAYTNWLLLAKEMKYGDKPLNEADLQLPLLVRTLLIELQNQTLPIDLYAEIFTRWLDKQLEGDVSPLLKPHLALVDFDDAMLETLTCILSALDRMVNYWYQKYRIAR